MVLAVHFFIVFLHYVFVVLMFYWIFYICIFIHFYLSHPEAANCCDMVG